MSNVRFIASTCKQMQLKGQPTVFSSTALISKHLSIYSEIHNVYNEYNCTGMHYIILEVIKICLGCYINRCTQKCIKCGPAKLGFYKDTNIGLIDTRIDMSLTWLKTNKVSLSSMKTGWCTMWECIMKINKIHCSQAWKWLPFMYISRC